MTTFNYTYSAPSITDPDARNKVEAILNDVAFENCQLGFKEGIVAGISFTLGAAAGCYIGKKIYGFVKNDVVPKFKAYKEKKK